MDKQKTNQTNIYVLLLEENKYYIGKSSDVEKRYQEHLNGLGSAWTNKYKPIILERTIQNANSFDEDRYVKEYMHMYGIDNIRGGSYSMLELSDNQKEVIKKEIWGANDCCNKCGKKDHFINNCSEKYDVDGNKINKNWLDIIYVNITKTINLLSNTNINILNPPNLSNNMCYRCGRTGHYIRQCYARTHINGNVL